ncbi:MAG TPA: GTP 3',8-cyclase MoaA [Bellilinea sp.]|nr:GTP 3',8-cyclase MoaA [Bellilinea sp.]
MLIDSWGRQITYLRISVTDRCNFRCVYCMPPEGLTWQPHESIMRYEEIVEVAKAAAEQGVSQIRLTGGEPLVRADLPVLVKMLAEIPGIDDISLTTNAMLLEKMAEKLKDAGLTRVNVSLDTLDADKFSKITRGGALERVLKGIEAAEAAGLTPIKINVVAMRGVNDEEFLELAQLTLQHPWHIRFIELMPIGNQQPWGEGFPLPQDAYISIQEIFEKLKPLSLISQDDAIGFGPAIEYRVSGGKGKIGFISPLSEHQFCQRCNRLRLTADGYLRPCLMSSMEVPVLSALRAGQPALPIIQQAVNAKPESHKLASESAPEGRRMIQIGG